MKNLKINWNGFLGKRGLSLVLAATIAVGLSGCSKKVECSVEGSHAHLYVSDDGYRTYFDNEHERYYGYNRQDDYVSLTEEDKELIDFLKRKELISLKDNLNVILKEAENREDYLEYRYKFSAKKRSTPSRRINGYSWTTDPEHKGLTGEVRVCHYVYKAYNVYKDENGKFVIIPSEEVDNIEDLANDYNYVRKDCYKAVNLENREELDYEDGDPEDLIFYVVEYPRSVPIDETSFEKSKGR